MTLDDFAKDALAGSSVRIETTVLPDIVVKLDDPNPSPLARLLKPRVTLTRGNVAIYGAAPYGAPDDGNTQFIVILAVAALVLFFLFR